MWGGNDPFIIPAGAAAFRDVPDADVVVLDAGQFALVEDLDRIAAVVDAFLRNLNPT